MKTTKLAKLAVGIVYVWLATASVADKKPDLNGTWKLNAEKSDFGGGPPPKNFVVHVNIQEPKLRMDVSETTWDDQKQEYSMELTTDGTPVTHQDGQKQISDSARWDGPVLIVEHKETEFSLTRRITLAPDGKFVISKEVFKLPDGESAITEVFERQP